MQRWQRFACAWLLIMGPAAARAQGPAPAGALEDKPAATDATVLDLQPDGNGTAAWRDPPAEEASPYLLSFQLENDGWFLKPGGTDRYNTNATRLSLTYEPEWADRLARAMPFGGDTDYNRTAGGFVLGQDIYTPARTGREGLQREDRPYAGWLFGGLFWQRIAPREMDHFQVNVGMVGPSAQGEETQNWIHGVFDDEEVRGWEHQLRDEPGIDFIAIRRWKIPLGGVAGEGWASELIPQAGFTLGTVHRHASAGALWRLGVNLPDDFGPPRIDEVAAGARPPSRSGAYFFTRVQGRAVEHNLFIEGNTWRESHGVDEEPLVGELQVGIAAHLGPLLVTYSQTFMTEEFKGQDGHQEMGTLTASLQWEF